MDQNEQYQTNNINMIKIMLTLMTACPPHEIFWLNPFIILKFYTLEHIFNFELRSVINTDPAPRNA